MSSISYDNFGQLGKILSKKNLLASGRYSWMNRFYKNISIDILEKLSLHKKDHLLDIGCGDARIINFLSNYVERSAVIDHPNIISVLKKKKKIDYYKGNILIDHKIIKKKFSKILVYSLIHYLENKETLFRLINICLRKLKPEGVLMLGDIPNLDKKKRFSKSKNFNEINFRWINNMNKKILYSEKKLIKTLEKDNRCIEINDKLILEILKKFTNEKSEVYINNQNNKLPMNFSRLDVIIKKYSD